MLLHPISYYARELKPGLPANAFAPARSRLVWLPVHFVIIALATTVIAAGWVPWPVALLLSVVIGFSFAGLSFLGHETLHGAVVRGRRSRRIVGWLGLLPFVVSPRLWIAWHNRVHHGHTSQTGVDPDAYQTLAQYQCSRLVRVVTNHFSLGRRRWAGALSLFLGFSFKSAHVLIQARTLGFLSPREHRCAIIETALGVGVWAALAVLVGMVPFLFVFVLPLLVANAIVMAFILTNHSLSPLTEVNDPLINSLSVTTPGWVEWATLRFGFHVEHHIFPAMSSRQAPRVRALIRARWPERYQSMPLGRALLAMVRTARIYKNPNTLVDPRTGREWPTLEPCGVRAAQSHPRAGLSDGMRAPA